ncbi:glutamate-5-semialdehyde dehydrogenase [Alicyclobacillaceae bacterium I2511]|nr:glutamate-5-semialdehyde dehydrogenase [Alicyclobacillaceae bacterium I2511]
MYPDTGKQSELHRVLKAQANAAQQAAHVLAVAQTGVKNQGLLAMAQALLDHQEAILAANVGDVAAALAKGDGAARVDRLRLTQARLEEMCQGLRQVANLPNPVGEVMESFTRPNGLAIAKIRVPFGVVGMVYEARPNVTVDAAGLAIKTGNAVLLRGGREALATNQALVEALRAGLVAVGLPKDGVQLISRTEHESVDLLIRMRGLVDLVIPRGGAGLIARVVENATVPVIETGVGNCHVYVDQAADFTKAWAIVLNAKAQRPSVCNAMETLLVHRNVAPQWLPEMVRRLLAAGVEVRACATSRDILRGAEENPVDLVKTPLWEQVEAVTEEDYATEFLDLIVALRVVDSLSEAMDHIQHYGTRHSESIVTEDSFAAEKFLSQVDAAAVYHNASTRFTDGFEFGFGAEIGISTQKLHARGPMGLRELTSYKYVIRGTGQVRE